MKPDNSQLAELLKEGSSILTAMENELGLSKDRELHAVLQKQMVARKESRNIIAVTGTMKAGKSTTLNTILGEELLPSRERAMTALPTLIRHVPESKTPLLHLPAAREYYNMLLEMRETFKARAIKADPATARILNELADFDLFLDIYTGPEIKRILSLINDLFREYANAGGSVPANLYRDSSLFPSVEKSLEMFGRLGISDKDIWLMDTPGINEAGQKELGYGLEYYLAGVSGLILIIDYAQQNSEAFADLLKRVYVNNPELIDQTLILLNKSDNWSSKDGSLEESRQTIASQIFKNCISLEKIFPVSAKYAFQGMEAKKQLLAGKTPAELGKDFWALALGDMWEDIYPVDDRECAIVHAEKLYARSAINEALNTSFFENQIASRQKREEDNLGQIYNAITGIGAKLKKIQNEAEHNCLQKRDAGTKASQRLQHAQDTLTRFSKIISNIHGDLRKTFADLTISPRDLVTADVRRDYWYSTERSKEYIADNCQPKNDAFKEHLNNHRKNLVQTARKKIDEIQWYLNGLINDFQLLEANDKKLLYIRHSFRADFYRPKVLIRASDYEVYITKKRSRTSYRRREGLSGWLGGMLDDIIDNDWGKVRHYETETRYYIKADYLNENLLKNAAIQLNALYQAAYDTIIQPFIASAENALVSLRETVKEMNLEAACDNARLALGSAEKELQVLEKLLVRFNKLSEKFPLFGNRKPSE